MFNIFKKIKSAITKDSRTEAQKQHDKTVERNKQEEEMKSFSKKRMLELINKDSIRSEITKKIRHNMDGTRAYYTYIPSSHLELPPYMLNSFEEYIESNDNNSLSIYHDFKIPLKDIGIDVPYVMLSYCSYDFTDFLSDSPELFLVFPIRDNEFREVLEK